MTKLPDDPTLDEVRAYVAPLLPAHAVFDGWTSAALVSAARETGLDSQMLELAFPGGATDMINAWFESLDEALTQAIPAQTLSEIKMRDRIAALVQARLDMMKMHREALRRAQSLLALPQNLGKAAKYGWRTADRIWRLAGDHATDFNHYSKRIILAGVYAATLLVFLDDESEGERETRGFLARRIDGIIRFERAKHRWQERRERRPSLSRFVGRLRYPAI